MAYETGTASSQHDLLDRLRLFLIAQGFTINMWADDTSSFYQPSLSTAGKRLHANKGDFYINLRSCVRAFPFGQYGTGPENASSDCYANNRYYSEVTGIAINMSTGFDAGQSWSRQPGSPRGSTDLSYGGTLTVISGAVPSYRFFYFDSPRMLLVSVEKSPGVFVHALFCNLEKVGSFVGGQFFCGSGNCYFTDKTPACMSLSYPPSTYSMSDFLLNSNTQFSETHQKGAVRVVGEDGASAGSYLDWRGWNGYKNGGNVFACCGPFMSGNYFAPYHDSNANPIDYSHVTTEGMILCATPSEYNAIVPLVRVPILSKRSTSMVTPQWAIAGYIPHIRLIRMDAFNVGEIISYGDDHWMVLPVLRKGVAGYTIGIAISHEV